MAQKGRNIQRSRADCLLFLRPLAHNEGECEWRNQHRPSKDTWIRPVQSRTSSMILTNDYQRTINLGREGPMTTPTQTKGQRSSLGLPVTSTPFSDLKAGCCQSCTTVSTPSPTALLYLKAFYFTCPFHVCFTPILRQATTLHGESS